MVCMDFYHHKRNAFCRSEYINSQAKLSFRFFLVPAKAICHKSFYGECYQAGGVITQITQQGLVPLLTQECGSNEE